MARRRRPQPRGWYEKKGDPAGTERFWDGEKWGPNPRFKKGVVPPKPVESTAAEAEPAMSKGASIWARITARSIDTLILLLPWFLLSSLAFSTETALLEDGTEETISSLSNPAYLWLAAGIIIVFEIGFTMTWGATPGKRLVGLVIVDGETSSYPLSLRPAVFRAVPLILTFSVPLVPLLWLACVAAMAIDRAQRSVFDFFGSTRVIPNPDRPGRMVMRRR